jgi:hypothetical protein
MKMTEVHSCSYHCDRPECVKAQRDELREKLAQPEQEPVAWEDVLGAIARGWAHPENARKPIDVQLAVAIAKEIQDMYTTPPAAQRQPQYNKTEMNCFVQNLYDQKMREGKRGHYETMFHVVHRAIEAAHGITGEKT